MDCAGVCGGDAVEDCANECGGSAEEDECGECGGDGSACAEPAANLFFSEHAKVLVIINILKFIMPLMP